MIAKSTAMTKTYYLQPPQGKKLLISEGENSVGRLSANKLIIRNSNVSGYHALIVRKGDLIWIEDKGSSNGTFVNEERLAQGQQMPLNKGDSVKFSSGITFQLKEVTEGTTRKVDPNEVAAVTEYMATEYAPPDDDLIAFSPGNKRAVSPGRDSPPPVNIEPTNASSAISSSASSLPAESAPAGPLSTNPVPAYQPPSDPQPVNSAQDNFIPDEFPSVESTPYQSKPKPNRRAKDIETEKMPQQQLDFWLQQFSPIYSEPTRLLSAAAHLNPWLYDQFKTYDREKYKASTSEYYIDLQSIRAETLKGRERERIRRFAHLAIMVFVPLFSWLTGAVMLSLFIAWFTAWMVNVLFDYSRQKYVRDHFLDFDTNTDYQVEPDAQNVIIYSGYSPFTGAGVEISKWSLSIDMTKPAESDKEPQQISESELFPEVCGEICNLNIPRLRLKDLLFVSGKELRNQKLMLPNILDKPRTQVEDHLVLRYMGNQDETVRHYRMIQVPLWHGQLVLSIFLRFIREGDNLFVESSSYLLPPLSSAYSEVDTLTSYIGLRAIADIFIKNIFTSLFSWVKIISWVVELISEELNHIFDRQASEIRCNFRYDYGRPLSFRESWSSGAFRQHFQELDNSMYFNILTDRLLDSLADSLEARGISVRKLRDQSQTILNQGVIVSGGSVKADNLAVGPMAAIKNMIGGTQFRRNGNQSTKGKDKSAVQ